MFIHQTAHYIPSRRVDNAHFEAINGLTSDWITERTGMYERSRAAEDENTNTMAIEATKLLQEKVDLSDVDLIVAGSYTFFDMIVTPAHATQRYLQLANIPVVGITTACSSFLNAAEIVEGYFAIGKSSKALVILSEQNSLYHNEADPKAGHLWGDGAVALLFTKERQSETDLTVVDITTSGAANVSKGTEGVMLRPMHGGIGMPHGKDVFINACNYMSTQTKSILERHDMTVDDLTYLVPHQANLRISKNVMQTLGLPEEKALSNVQYLGNTGSAGSAIALSEHWDEYKSGDVLVVVVFGGGYSYGAMLLKKD
ncbi:MAG: 3-oxoacyl-[acyl-carrier-protein] synthase III C-terminal domain-containing protein [Bacteroidota bacterium]